MHDDKHHKHHDDHDHHDGKPGKVRRPVIIISNYGMGHAPAELGLKLVQTYLGLLDVDDKLPTACLPVRRGREAGIEVRPFWTSCARWPRRARAWLSARPAWTCSA
ncbi:MAG: hypothetical protein IPH86_17105 [bacterium]|nr:hypothetical protein [bacterium]